MPLKRGSFFFCKDNGNFVKITGKKKGKNEYQTKVLRPNGEVVSGGIFSEKLIIEDLQLTPISACDRRLAKMEKSARRKYQAIKNFCAAGRK
jgi:hypothetical protein